MKSYISFVKIIIFIILACLYIYTSHVVNKSHKENTVLLWLIHRTHTYFYFTYNTLYYLFHTYRDIRIISYIKRMDIFANKQVSHSYKHVFIE